MKGRVIVLGEADQPISAALMVDGRLEDLDVRVSDTSAPSPGEIWRAKVTRKLPKAGAFCELDSGATGYLREARGVREGERLLVQVVSWPEAGKAATLTTRLLFKGPRLILTPSSPGVNVSRKIGNETERTRLADLIKGHLAEAAHDIPNRESIGVIVRTSARGQDARYLERELDALVKRCRWADRHLGAEDPPKAPLGINIGPFATPVSMNWLDPLPDEILLPEFEATLFSKDLSDNGPSHVWGDDRLVDCFRTVKHPLEEAGLPEALEAIRGPTVDLDGGASMVIEPTRALVAVDVNTGGDFSPNAGLKANLAAARDLPRQLRLRGLGGQIVVDFAPMGKKHRRTLEEALAKAFRADPVETSHIGWTRLGLYEMQRKRERLPLSEVL